MHVTYLRLPQPFFAMTCKALKESLQLTKFERKCLKSNLVVVHWVRKIRTKLGLHLKRIKQECMMFSQQISMSYNLRKTNFTQTSVETVSGRGGELITPRRAAHVSSNCCLEVHPDNKKQHTRVVLVPTYQDNERIKSFRTKKLRKILLKQLNETESSKCARYQRNNYMRQNQTTPRDTNENWMKQNS